MKLNKHRPFVLVALFSIIALSVSTGFAQEGRVACPFPFTKTLQGSGTFVNIQDMLPAWSGHPHQGIGGTAINTWSGYSFDFRKVLPGPCCQVTSAKLTVVFKALQGGACGSSTSANDGWGIVHAGGQGVTAGVAPPAGTIFPCPVTTGQTVTKVVTVTNQQVLNSGFLSIFAQDDTEIVSASLVITGCCVNMPGVPSAVTNLNSSRSNISLTGTE